jgi:hypothetical protein
VAVIVATAACARTTEQPGESNSKVIGWVCDRHGDEEMIAFESGRGVIVATSIETGEQRDVVRTNGTARSVVVAGGSIYWSDDKGIRSSEPGGGRARDLMLSPHVDTIATDGKRLVYSALDQLWLLDLATGDSRPFASLVSRYQDYPHIVVTPRAIYWGMVHIRGNFRVPEQDTLWSLALEPGARPVRIASLDLLNGFCVGPAGQVVWLDGGPGPAYNLPGSDGGKVTRLMTAGGPIAKIHARSHAPLVATDTGFAFTTDVEGSTDVNLWHVTRDGSLTRIPTSLTVEGILLRVENDAVVVEWDGRVRRVPIQR